MARGYPDYFGRSIWPKYGTGLVDEGAKVVNAGVTADVVSLTLQGVLVHLVMELASAASCADVVMHFEIDGTYIQALYINNLIKPPGLFSGRQLIYPTYFDMDYKDIFMTLGVEIPFHTSVRVTCANGGAAQVSCTRTALYYAVT